MRDAWLCTGIRGPGRVPEGSILWSEIVLSIEREHYFDGEGECIAAASTAAYLGSAVGYAGQSAGQFPLELYDR
jgi:hypothetical protein